MSEPATGPWQPIASAPIEAGKPFGPVLLRGVNEWRPGFEQFGRFDYSETAPVVGMWNGREWLSDICRASDYGDGDVSIEPRPISPTEWAAFSEPVEQNEP